MSLATPLVVQLPRQSGQKEVRYGHLMAGEPQYLASEPVASPAAPPPGRIDALEQEVASLRAELAELRARFEQFAREFQ